MLDGSSLDVKWYKDGVPLPEQERVAAGMPGFSLHFYAMPCQPTWASVAILLFPLPKKDLLETYPICLNPSFPGITLYSAKFCSLGFAADQVFDNQNFGTPILPCIIPGADWDESATAPTTSALVHAMAKTLRAAYKPVGKAGQKALKKKWDDLTLSGEAGLKPESPPFIWPEPAARSK